LVAKVIAASRWSSRATAVDRIGALMGGSETDSRAGERRSLPREMAVTKAS